uniref:Uncharacterized protein n=1 Tax=Aegilops tauschii subsp. strangulata TaxID=200361 RepID=A0A453T7S9_AEGTS
YFHRSKLIDATLVQHKYNFPTRGSSFELECAVGASFLALFPSQDQKLRALPRDRPQKKNPGAKCSRSSALPAGGASAVPRDAKAAAS